VRLCRVSLTVGSHIASGGKDLRQLLRRFLLGLVLVPTLLVWVAVGTAFFGYQAVGVFGISMEPTIHNGDALWVKCMDPARLKVGDIVTVVPPGEESITHRIVEIERLSNDDYFLTTRGDANDFTEEWEISSDWTVAVMIARVPFAGYILEFLASIFGRILIVSVTVTLFVIWMRGQQAARRVK
jgi:signal peptidase I